MRNVARRPAMGDASHAPRPVVIVVDDDPDVLGSLQFAFEVEGFEVWPFASGEALLDLGGVVEHGCLVVDYQLGGLDGLALLARLREQGNRLPAILITTANTVVALKAAQAGVDIVEKPLLCDTLIGEVRRLLQAASAQTSEPRGHPNA
jgi:FixJ family two-component response regulator